MIKWILENFKIFLMVILPLLAGTYTFVTIVFTSGKVNAQQDLRIQNIENRFIENGAILSGIKQDTQTIKEILYKQALKRGQE